MATPALNLPVSVRALGPEMRRPSTSDHGTPSTQVGAERHDHGNGIDLGLAGQGEGTGNAKGQASLRPFHHLHLETRLMAGDGRLFQCVALLGLDDIGEGVPGLVVDRLLVKILAQPCLPLEVPLDVGAYSFGGKFLWICCRVVPWSRLSLAVVCPLVQAPTNRDSMTATHAGFERIGGYSWFRIQPD